MLRFIPVTLLLFFAHSLSGQLQITVGNTTPTVTFDNTVPGVNNGVFTAIGFTPGAIAAGQIDSNGGIVTGFNDGTLDFGDTQTTLTTDFAKGATVGAELTPAVPAGDIAGVYSINSTTTTVNNSTLTLTGAATGTAAGTLFAIQPQGPDDFTPGSFQLKGVNATTGSIASLTLRADVCFRDNSLNSTEFSIEFSTDDGATFTSTGISQASPATSGGLLDPTIFYCARVAAPISLPTPLAPGDEIIFRVSAADAGTITGNDRDEFALDNITVGAVVLPVEMSYFRSRVQATDVQLEWGTSMELNNDYFLVEHSTDGNEFEVIGEVTGSGTTDRPVDYGFTHENAPLGTNYYRLVQTDYDGTEDVSETLSVVVKKDREPATLLPTVTADHATLNFTEALPHTLRADLIDLNGRIVQTRIVAGGDTETSFDLSDFGSGMYLIRYRLDEDVHTLRVVKR